jgi:hypothetical protein
MADPVAVVPEAERLKIPSTGVADATTSNAGVFAVRSLGSQPLGGSSTP